MRPQSAFRPRIDSAATVRELGGNSRPILAAKVLASEGKRLTLHSSAVLPIGAAVRVDVEGGLVFGEVVQSQAGVQGSTVILNIDQVIPSVSDLTNLLGSIFGNEMQTSMRANAGEMVPVDSRRR